MEKLLKDGNTMVLGSAVAAFTEVRFHTKTRWHSVRSFKQCDPGSKLRKGRELEKMCKVGYILCGYPVTYPNISNNNQMWYLGTLEYIPTKQTLGKVQRKYCTWEGAGDKVQRR